MSSLHNYEFSKIPSTGDPSPKAAPATTGATPFLVSTASNPTPASLTELTIALIGPNDERRIAAAQALAACAVFRIREFSSYPHGVQNVPRILEENYDVVIVDLDSDPEYALELVENIGVSGVATVMVYSDQSHPELLVRCMRAGAREFLALPFEPSVLHEALVRAAARRPATRAMQKAAGRLMAFMGAKGGAGATTLACNFAVALAQETGESTLLIDLDLPLGDAALNLGIVAEYSTIDALQSGDRLDASFLAQLLVKHSSGVSVLAAPGRFLPYEPNDEAIDRLLTLARSEFENVVVDLGSRQDWTGSELFREATSLYLVTQAGIPELRNSNRLISQFFSGNGPRLEIVINRYEARSMGVAEEHITKALTRPAQWKIPNDYPAVRKMQISATPLALSDSPISRLIRQMARAAAGKTETESKKKGFSFFG